MLRLFKKRNLNRGHVRDKREPGFGVFRILREFTLFGLAGFFIVATIAIIWLLFFVSLPTIDSFQDRKIANSTKIYDVSGEIVLYDIHKNISRSVVSADKISDNIKNAVISIEDKRFYEHNGIVPRSIMRAVRDQILDMFGVASNTGGGSTITQQVVKNTLLTPEKSIIRKIKEWILAIKLDKELSKEEILTEYLNEIPLGGTVYGVEEACRRFFGKHAIDVTVVESAYIAAIINRPTFYSPYGQNRENLEKRKDYVLRLMHEQGLISEDEYATAINTEVKFIPRQNTGAKAIHFVEYVRAYLEEKYGIDTVENGGLQVITTLDYELQELAEEVAETQSLENQEKYDASNIGIVVLDPETGAIITMVGSRDYFDEEVDGAYNVTLAKRQPGSAFKPIAYASAFEKGYLPETIIFDAETQFTPACREYDFDSPLPCYAPRNYDNKFLGPVSFRDALAQSRNIPAVKVLYLAGIDYVMENARKSGIMTLTENRDHYGLSLVLGGGEVTLLELASAYATFANDGVHVPTHSIVEIRAKDGSILEKHTEVDGDRVFNRDSARALNSILSDNNARTPLFGAHSQLYFGANRPIAGKTGTTNDNRDAWLIGYTPNIVVGVWTGNNDNSRMKKGSSISLPTWRAVMEESLDIYGYDKFQKYDSDHSKKYPAIVRGIIEPTRQLIQDDDENIFENEDDGETYIGSIHTILHWIDKDNPKKQKGRAGDSDPQYENWEFSVQNWLAKSGRNLFSFFNYEENERVDRREEDEKEGIKIVIFMAKSPPINRLAEIELSVKDHDEEIVLAEYFVNDLLLGTTERPPFSFAFSPERVSVLDFDRENTLRVELTDTNGNIFATEKEFTIGLPVEEF